MRQPASDPDPNRLAPGHSLLRIARLVRHLFEAAEALDWMSQRFDLQHLDVKPGNLFLVSNHIKVADFGLVTRLQDLNDGSAAKAQLGGITPLYSSPEVFLGKVSRQSD